MRTLFKVVIIVFLVVFSCCVAFILLNLDATNTIQEINEHTENTYGSISFKGKVLAIHKIRRGGRTYGIMCVKVDYSNTEAFYRFDEITCLKIQDSIATMPIGFLGEHPIEPGKSILNSQYVEVNMNKTRKMIFYDNNWNSCSTNLDYRNNNLRESDMSVCN
jgi:hypothetical protein